MTNHRDIVVSLFAADGTRKYLTTSEIKRFLSQADKQEDRVKLLCQVLAYTGCRLSEALNLTTAAIDVENLAITFRTLKRRRNGIYRQVPVPAFLLHRLLEHASSQNERLWPVHRQTGRRWVAEVMTNADIEGVRATTRGLRHGFAVGALEDDIPITLLQKWMGHARLETTSIYADVVGEEERRFAERRWSTIEA